MESAKPEINEPSESGKMAQTWFFRAFICLKDGQTFSNLLDEHKQQLETSLASAVISWACAITVQTLLETQDSNHDCVWLEGFVHSSTYIWLGSLKCVILGKQDTDAGDIVEAAPARITCVTPQSRHFLEKPRWIRSLLIKESG